MKKYDAVVIGAGNNGLFAAAGLAASGLKPLVIEAHNLPGGLAAGFVRGRFEFDATLHGLNRQNITETLHDELHMQTEFPLFPHQVGFVTVQDGAVHRDFYDFGGSIPDQLDAKYPGKEYGKIYAELIPIISNIRDGAVKSLKVVGNLKNRSGELASLKDIASYMVGILKDHPRMLQIGLRHTETIYKKYNVPLYLRSLLSMCWWYIGVRLDRTFALLNFATTDYDQPFGYVKDTAHSYLAELETIIRSHGGEILYNTSATKICVEDGKLVGIETSQGDYIETEHCICTVDPKVVLGKLIDGDQKYKDFFLPKEESLKDGFSFFMIYMGLDCTPEEMGITVPHIVINETLEPNDLIDGMEDLSAPKTIGVMCPNLVVDGASPEGTSIVSLSIPVMPGVMEGLSQKDYFKLKNEYADRLITKVEEYLGVDFHSHIEEIEIASPVTFARYSGSNAGSIGNELSIGTLIKTVVTAMLMNKKIKGLTFAGQFVVMPAYENINIGYGTGKKLAKKIKEGK